MTSDVQNSSFLSYLQTRRTVPTINLGQPGPSRADLDDILTIAARVPDHGKIAPWRFVLYSPEDGVKIGSFLRDVWLRDNPDAPEDRLALEAIRFSRAPVVVGVISCPLREHKIPVWEQELSVGAVCMNLMHAAHACGFSAQWLTEWYSFNAETAHFLGAGDGERFAGFIHIGTPKVDPVERARPDMSERVQRWSSAS